MKRVLVFAPHPDDDLIGCGGSMAKHARQGNEVAVVYLTSGEAGSIKHPPGELAGIREAEAARAGRVIGVSEAIFLRNPDGFLGYGRENITGLTGLIRRKRPDLVYVPHHRELHSDHTTTNRLVIECCRRASGPWFAECEGEPWSVGTILGYEVWTPLARIGCVEDVSDYMELKLEALRMHRSQIEDIRYDEAVQGLNRYRGIMTGRGDYCECFQVIRTNL